MALRNWRGPAAISAIRGEIKKNANAAMLIGVNATKQKLSVPGPTPSAPGEPPHAQTGTLRRGVTGKVADEGKNIVILVGVAGVPYAAALEYGTSRVAARPYVRPALLENRKAIFDAIGGGF